MATRNFWIEANIDGRKTDLRGGPRSKDGGFDMTIYIRDAGGIVNAITVLGRERDGRLSLTAFDETNSGIPAITIDKQR